MSCGLALAPRPSPPPNRPTAAATPAVQGEVTDFGEKQDELQAKQEEYANNSGRISELTNELAAVGARVHKRRPGNARNGAARGPPARSWSPERPTPPGQNVKPCGTATVASVAPSVHTAELLHINDPR